jgi:hypothetical protein
MKGHRGKKGIYIIRAEKGLLDEKDWELVLKKYPTALVCLIREKLRRKMPEINEKFNRNSRYFGYWIGNDKDKIYIYVQKKRLVIDMFISPDFITDIEKLGFKVKPRTNFQERADWLTGWEIPQSTTNIRQIIDWLCKAYNK